MASVFPPMHMADPMTRTLSPLGYYYRFDMNAPSGERLSRKRHMEQPWEVGKPEFSIQLMSADELRFVAGVIDEARVGGGEVSESKAAWERLKDTWHGWWAIYHASKFADHALKKGQPYLALRVARLIDDVSIRGDRIDGP